MKKTVLLNEESGCLELLQDLETHQNHGVSPSDVGEMIIKDTPKVKYEADEDPEIEPGVLPTLDQASLHESKNQAVRDFLRSNGEDKMFSTFKDSEFYEDSQNAKGELCSEKEYYTAVKYLVDKNEVTRAQAGNALYAPKKSDKLAYGTSSRDEDTGPYKREYDEDSGEPPVLSSELSKWVNEYDGSSGRSMDVNEIFDETSAIVREIITGVSDKRHCCIAGDPGIGKTHTVMETIYKYFDKNGRPKGGTTLSRMTAVSGSMSKAITAVAAFFYLHRNNELIVFDDCDKVIINDGNEDAANFMKAILDPEALDKPASINLTQAGMKMAQANYSRLRDLEINKAMMNEGVYVKIDMDALREGFFRYSVNGTVRDCVRLTEAERLELSNRIREGAFDEYEEVDEFDNDGPTVVEEDEDKMASEFIFNSSVIFISNLRLQDITDAVADRCEQVEISLTLPQFMDRLTSVIPGLFNGKKYSSRPSFMREWAKSAVLVYFKGVIEAYNTHTPLLGKQVYIKRKLTFRLFEEMCNEFCRKAAMYADSHELGLDDKENQRKIQEMIHTPFLKSFLNKLEMVGGKR